MINSKYSTQVTQTDVNRLCIAIMNMNDFRSPVPM